MMYMLYLRTCFSAGDISNHKQLHVPGFVKPTTGATLQILISTSPELPDSAATFYVYNASTIHVDFFVKKFIKEGQAPQISGKFML